MPSYPLPFSAQLLSLESMAHQSAFGINQPRPTPAQCQAGNYRVGKVQWQGLTICIEQPEGSIREGKDAGQKEWRTLMAAHYGYVQGTKGADGDAVDVFLGTFVDSLRVYVINQGWERFDEHKAMLCFPDMESARSAYMRSYSRGWTGLQSIVPMTLSQFKWWLQHGDMTRPVTAEQLPFEPSEESPMKRTYWGDNAQPIGTDIDQLLYALRQHDGEDALLLDSASCTAITTDPENESSLALDAMVTPFQHVERKMATLRAVMDRSGQDVKTVAMQVSDPFKQRGTVNVAVVYELSDGQTVSVYLHNPDTTPAKLAPQDELISWKWMLNKKDITIVVAPEYGQDLNIREVSRRIMKLADKNSAAFKRANEKRASRLQNIAGMTAEVEQLEKDLTKAQHELEVARQEVEDHNTKKQASEAARKAADAAYLPEGWTESRPGGMATKTGEFGGIVDTEPTSGKWFVVFEAKSLQPSEAIFNTRREAFTFFEESIAKIKAAEPHYSDKILQALVDGHGWEMTSNGAARKYFPGVRAGGEAVPDGGRWFYATYSADRERRRYVSVMLGDKELFDLDGRDADPVKLASELEAKAESKAQEMRDALKPAAPALPEGGYLSKVHAQMLELQKELDAKGVSYPSAAQFMKDVNAGHRIGFTVFDLTAKQAKSQSELEKIKTGQLRPSVIVGRGATKASATAYLEKDIADIQLALDSDGLMNVTNLGNYVSTLRTILTTGADDGFRDDEAKAAEAAAQAEREKEEAAKEEQLQADFVSSRQYEEGEHASMRRPLEVKFAIPVHMRQFTVDLRNMTGIQERYVKLLNSTRSGSGIKQMPFNNFSVAVDLNSALKRGTEFGYFSMEIRKGYTLVTLAIDLAANAAEAAGGKAAIQLIEQVAKILESMGWKIEPVREGYSAVSQAGNEVVMEPDAGGKYLDIKGSSVTAHVDDTPGNIAQKLDAEEWRATVDLAHDGEVVDDEESEYHGQRLEFVRGNMDLEAAVEEIGAQLVWGDFNASLHNGTLFDAATHDGVSAQIGKDGRVFARAAIASNGIVTIYKGVSGDAVAEQTGSKAAMKQALLALLEAMPAPEPDAAPVSEPAPAAAETAEGGAPAQTVVSQLNELRKLLPKGDIRSDDPQAIEKLRAKAAYLDAYSDLMRKANRLVRANKREELAAMGFSEAVIAGLFKADFAGRIGFPDYELKNTNAEARRTKMRLFDMEQQAAAQNQSSSEAPAYEFKNVLSGDDFAAWAESNPLRHSTAVAMDKAAIEAGGHILWFTPSGATMDSATMDSALSHAIAILIAAGGVASNNAPIHAAEGDQAQAELSAEVAQGAQAAAELLQQHESSINLVFDSAKSDGATLCGTIFKDRKARGYVALRNDGKAMIYTDAQGNERLQDGSGDVMAFAADEGAAALVAAAMAEAPVNPVTTPGQDGGEAAAAGAAAQDPQRAADVEFLTGIVNGQTDPLTASLEELEAIYARNAEDVQINSLFEQAVNVVTNAELSATASV